MADQKDTYLAEEKFTGVRIKPENLIIVGLDCANEECPDLADPDRIALPIDDLVISIAAHGIRVPIAIRKYPGATKAYVVTGRRRVRAAREANLLLADDFKILVPCVPEDKGKDVLTSLVIENEFRVGDTPLAKARKAARMKVRARKNATKGGQSVSSAPRKLSAKLLKVFVGSLEPSDADKNNFDAGYDADDVYLRVAHATLRAIGGEGESAFEDYPVLAAKFRAATSPVTETDANGAEVTRA